MDHAHIGIPESIRENKILMIDEQQTQSEDIIGKHEPESQSHLQRSQCLKLGEGSLSKNRIEIFSPKNNAGPYNLYRSWRIAEGVTVGLVNIDGPS